MSSPGCGVREKVFDLQLRATHPVLVQSAAREEDQILINIICLNFGFYSRD